MTEPICNDYSIAPRLKIRDSTILDLQTQLENRHRELNVLEQSVTNTHVERTRLQLNFNEMSMTLVTVRQELEESRAAATAARVAEEAGRLQLARMMDEQLVQNQTIESLRRQLETSNTATRDAQALLRMNQEQQPQNGRMPPTADCPSSFDSGCYQQYSLCPTLRNSRNRTTDERIARSRLLSCGFTGRPRLCRKYAGHVWERRSGPTTT